MELENSFVSPRGCGGAPSIIKWKFRGSSIFAFTLILLNWFKVCILSMQIECKYDSAGKHIPGG